MIPICSGQFVAAYTARRSSIVVPGVDRWDNLDQDLFLNFQACEWWTYAMNAEWEGIVVPRVNRLPAFVRKWAASDDIQYFCADGRGFKWV